MVAGLAPLRVHDLRHTAVSLWIAAGDDAKVISVRAGGKVTFKTPKSRAGRTSGPVRGWTR